MTQTAARVDPYRSYNFIVEFDGIALGIFTDCSGLESTTEAIDHREGGDNTTVHKLPGKTTYSHIMLKWGTTDYKDLMAWRQHIIDGTIDRRNGSVVLYDLANSKEVARWNFTNAWPTKWTGPTLDAKGNGIAQESLELAHEGVTRS